MKPDNAVRLTVVPCELSEANDFVTRLHRHHKKATGHRWSCAVLADGATVGVAIIGRPVARMTDQRRIVEAIRVCTDGTPNACSALYGAVCRQQRAHGYEKAQTFILESEPGTSLRAAGWKPVAYSDGGSWSRQTRLRLDDAPLDRKIRWECPCSTLPEQVQGRRHEDADPDRRLASPTDHNGGQPRALCQSVSFPRGPLFTASLGPEDRGSR